MQNKKHYIIYKTTNLIDGMFYIGQHSTFNPNDSYMGSGTQLKEAINEFGKHIFHKEILYDFDNFDDMNNKEIEIVNLDFVEDTNTYNMVVGGAGCISTPPRNVDTSIICITKDGVNNWIQAHLLPRWKDKGWVILPANNKQRKPISASSDMTNICITKDGDTKWIRAYLLPRWEDKGWVKRPKMRDVSPIPEDADMTLVCITKNGKRRYISAYLLPKRISEGWELVHVGKRSPIPKDADMTNICITKDGVTKPIRAYLLPRWEDRGWTRKPPRWG